MHGGAKGSGAPKGNQNAFKHGLYTAEAKAFAKHMRDLLRDGKSMIDDFLFGCARQKACAARVQRDGAKATTLAGPSDGRE